MSNTFLIEILTPERVFFTGLVKSVSVEALDGRVSVMANHAPMVCALSAGKLVIETEEGQRFAFHSKGFLDVTKDYVVLLCQTCEWPEEIDENRASLAAKRAEERLIKASDPEIIRSSNSALMRARSRLQVKNLTNKYKK